MRRYKIRSPNDLLLREWLAKPRVKLTDPRPVFLEGCWMIGGLDEQGENWLFARLREGGFEKIAGPTRFEQGKLL